MYSLRFGSLVVALGIFTLSPVAEAKPGQKPSKSQEGSKAPSAAKMPMLRSAHFEKQWGAPDLAILEDGGYRMRFRQGTTLNYFFIYGLTRAKAAPKTPPAWHEDDLGKPTPEHKQEWQTATILGKTVKWYQADGGSGADFPSFQTVDFSLTAPDGRVGYYRIVANCTSKKDAADWIQRVNW